LQATQLCYYPFDRPQRAARQEFGDVLAEGLYALLHLGLGWEQATREYWTLFLEVRRNFLEGVITRLANASPGMRADMRVSLQSAVKTTLAIKADVCARYVRHWRQDLADWKQRIAGIPEKSSIEAALEYMQLRPFASIGITGRIPQRLQEAAPSITAGAVAIPRFDTLDELFECASALGLNSTVSGEQERDSSVAPVLTTERLQLSS
jgi:hypothetical protein